MKERIMRFGLPALAVATSVGIGFAGVTSAQTAPIGSPSAQQRPFAGGERPALFGKITAISGSNVTVASMDRRDSSETDVTSYTVDASAAKILKASAGSAPAETNISALNAGDMIAVRGSISGTSVSATEIVDGVGIGMGHGRGPSKGMGEGAMGTVTAISGSSITLSGKDGKTYTVDASSAKIGKVQMIQIGDIKIGDTVGVRGAVSGTHISAKEIMDGLPSAPEQH